MAKKAQRGGRPSAWIKLPKDRMISLEHAEQESVAKKVSNPTARIGMPPSLSTFMVVENNSNRE